MAEITKPTKAQIDQVVELMDETGIDLFLDVLPEIFINWEDETVLALLPAEIVQNALVYLREQKKEQDEEEDC
jgi:two-component sensor histidine kinase